MRTVGPKSWLDQTLASMTLAEVAPTVDALEAGRQRQVAVLTSAPAPPPMPSLVDAVPTVEGLLSRGQRVAQDAAFSAAQSGAQTTRSLLSAVPTVEALLGLPAPASTPGRTTGFTGAPAAMPATPRPVLPTTGEEIGDIVIAGGANPDRQRQAYREARASGLDDEGARVLLAVLETEGGMSGAIGDQGQAHGGYQFHEGGELHGFAQWLGTTIEDARTKAHDIALTTRYAAETYLGRAIEAGRRLGLAGAELATYVQEHGQRSVRPETTGANYTRLFGGQPAAMPQQSARQGTVPMAGAEGDTPSSNEVVRTAGRFARNQGEVGNELGLPWARTIEICGPIAAAAFLRATGRFPGREEAEAMRVAQEKGYWQPGRGMGGTVTQEQLLNDLGVATKRVEGSPDWRAVAADVQRGNPVIIDGGDHYMVVEGYDPRTGEFDFGETAGFLRASGGRTKFRPEELPSLSSADIRISPTAAIFLDNPETPGRSVVAGRVSNVPRPADAQVMPDRGNTGARLEPIPLAPHEAPISRANDPRVQQLSAPPANEPPAPWANERTTYGDAGDAMYRHSFGQPADEPLEGGGALSPIYAGEEAAASSPASYEPYRDAPAPSPSFASSASYGNGGDDPGQRLPAVPLDGDTPSSGEQIAGTTLYGPPDPWQQVNPLEPGTLRPSDLPGRGRPLPPGRIDVPGQPIQGSGFALPPAVQDQVIPRSAQTAPVPPQEQPPQQPVTLPLAPAQPAPATHPPPSRMLLDPSIRSGERTPADVAEEAASSPYGSPQPIPTLPGAAGRVLTEDARRARSSPSQQLSPLAILQAVGELPFDVVTRIRQEAISDAEQGRMSGTDPLAPFRPVAAQLGIPLPDAETVNPEGRPAADIWIGLGVAGIAPDPMDPAVGLALRGAGAGLRASGRAVRAGAEAVAPVASAAGRGIASAGRALGETAGRMAMDMPTTPRMVQSGDMFGGGLAPEPREPGVGRYTSAFGADPRNVYDLRWRVVDLDDLTPSNLDNGAPNPAFPQELQPRARDRAGSQLQIDSIARDLNPDALLTDVRQLDRGAPIVGPDGIVESGNGRILALRRAAQQYPERFAGYVDAMAGRLDEYGLTMDDLRGVRTPVLVRERVSDVDRAAFAAEANQASTLQMSPLEVARQDASRLPIVSVSRISTSPTATLDQSLTSAANRDLVRSFMATLPANERAALVDANGNLNAQGLQRLKAALFASVYQGEAGERLTRAFFESVDPDMRNVETALYGSLPDLARLEAGVRTGQVDPSYSLADDLATAVDMYARLRASGMSVGDYLAQVPMFGERETTPFQDALMQFIDQNRRSQKPLRDLVKRYAEGVEAVPSADQVGMFGAVERPNRGELLDRAVTRANADAADDAAGAGQPGLFGTADAPDAGANVGRNPAANQELARPAGPGEPAGAASPNPRGTGRSGRSDLEAADELDTTARAERLLGVEAGTLGRATDRAAVDEAVRVADRLEGALERVRGAKSDPDALSGDAQIDAADALLEAAETRLRLQGGTSAETRAARRVIGQRRAQIAAARATQEAGQADALAEAANSAADLAGRAHPTTRRAGERTRRLQAVRERLVELEGASETSDAVDAALTGVEARRAAARGRPEPARLPPVADDAAPAGGPAGDLSVQGQPAAPRTIQPANRAPVGEGMAPTGGPEGTLRVQGQPADAPAPVQPARLPAVGDRAAPAGGPEGTLRVQRVQGQPANLGPIRQGDLPAGGPEGTLAVQGAPQPAAHPRPVPANMAPTGGPEGRLQAPPLNSPAQQRAIDQARIRAVVAQIDEVLANPDADGAVERWKQLQADLREIGKQGAQRGLAIRERLYRNGLQRAGLTAKTADVQPLLSAIEAVDPSRPQDVRALLTILSKPRLIDKVLEFQFVNMLSSPITHGVNILANAAQVAGRLLLQNPGEFVFSGGQSRGVRAAFRGAARGAREGGSEAWQIMRSGVARGDIERATELGEWSAINREYLTEQFGPLGAFFHVISTRPLAAMDALFGRMAYASVVEQLAQRQADKLLRAGDASVKGMSRADAQRHIMQNIWDHPDLIDRAGKIEEYTLLRSKDIGPDAWGKVERAIRQGGALRVAGPGAGAGEQMVAFLANEIVPFLGVPLNYAKQGAERTVGVPVNLVRGLRAAARGDREQQGELLTKAAIGAGTLATAGYLALGDNLTGEGPTDPGQRRIWEQTHRRNSYRVPGTNQWLSWEGTPWGIPFGMVAGATEGWQEARERAEKKGQTDPTDAIGSAALNAGRGATSAFLSQSFVRSLGDYYEMLTGDRVSLTGAAVQAASSVSRRIPASGMLAFLARLGDDLERDASKPQRASEIPENVGKRLQSRLPAELGAIGIPNREQLAPRTGPYGTPVPNEQAFPRGLLPYYRGPAPGQNDPITRKLEGARVGVGPVSDRLSGALVGAEGRQIQLTAAEQKRLDELRGQAFRERLERTNAGVRDYRPDVLERLRGEALEVAQRRLVSEIGVTEARRRAVAPQPAVAR